MKFVRKAKAITIAIMTSFMLLTSSVSSYVHAEKAKILHNDVKHLKNKNRELEEVVGGKDNEIKELQKDVNNLSKENKQLKKSQKNINEHDIEQLFMFACDVYRIDYKLPFAIAKLETGHFTSKLYKTKNNVGGMRDSKGWKSYSSVSEGVFEMVRNIKNNYIDIGLDTPEKMNSKYCPDDLTWASKVRQIMNKL